MELYVYYRAATEHAQQLKSRVLTMQEQLHAQSSVKTALKRRPHEEAGMHTWMEVYLAAPEGFEELLQQAVHDADLTALIHGPRHIEYFLDSASCA